MINILIAMGVTILYFLLYSYAKLQTNRENKIIKSIFFSFWLQSGIGFVFLFKKILYLFGWFIENYLRNKMALKRVLDLTGFEQFLRIIRCWLDVWPTWRHIIEETKIKDLDKDCAAHITAMYIDLVHCTHPPLPSPTT